MHITPWYPWKLLQLCVLVVLFTSSAARPLHRKHSQAELMTPSSKQAEARLAKSLMRGRHLPDGVTNYHRRLAIERQTMVEAVAFFCAALQRFPQAAPVARRAELSTTAASACRDAHTLKGRLLGQLKRADTHGRPGQRATAGMQATFQEFAALLDATKNRTEEAFPFEGQPARPSGVVMTNQSLRSAGGQNRMRQYIAWHFSTLHDATRSMLASLSAVRTPSRMHVLPQGGVCCENRAVPQLYVIGAMKAATTSFAQAFGEIGGRFATGASCQHCVLITDSGTTVLKDVRPGECYQQGGLWHANRNASTQLQCLAANGVWEVSHAQKERNIFNMLGSLNASTEDFGTSSFRNRLVEGLPACPRDGDSPIAVGDFTPTYMVDPLAPARVRFAYAGVGRHLVFGMLLREPMSRLQAAYHHLAQEPYFRGSWWDSFQNLKNFSGFVETLLLARRETPSCFFGVWDPTCVGVAVGERSRLFAQLLRMFDGSLYGKALQRWVNFFAPPQFVIVPMTHFLQGSSGKNLIFKEIFEALGMNALIRSLPFAGGAAGAEREHRVYNSHNHSTVQAELEPQLFTQLQEPLSEDLALLVEMISNYTEIRLPTMREPRSASTIRHCLSSGW